MSYFGSIESRGWQDFGGTINGMMNLVQLLIPIIALMLGYAAIIGEIERGSMGSLLSLPTTRLEILLGKFFGLGSVLSLTIVIGFGVAGVVIAANVPGVNYMGYLAFIGSTILLGLTFLSLALFFSSLFKKRSAAMGGAILLWFLFNMILPILFMGILVMSIGLESFVLGEIPDWYFGLQLLNPLFVYSTLISLNVSQVSPLGFSENYPSFITSELMVSILFLWILIFFFCAFYVFKRKDI
jgi:Cu-processing system permease protein